MTSEIINYVGRYGGSCRDCADNDGVCDRGTPCDPKVFRAAIEHTIKALDYGIKHGFIENPFTSAVPDVPELVRWKHCEYPNQHKMIEHTDGEYVLHSEATAIIAVERESKHLAQKAVIGLEREVEQLTTMLAKPDGRGEFNRGYVIACCNLVNLHGADIVAVDTLKQLGITRTDIDAMDLSEYDLSALILLESHFSADQIYAPESKK